MKKITFLSFLLITALSFGQQLPYDFESGVPAPNFQFGGLGYTDVANPDTNNNPSANVLQVDKGIGAEWFGGFGFGDPAGPIIANMANGTEFTLKVWSSKANVPIRFELQRPGEVSYNVIQTVATSGAWVDVSFDFSSQVNGSEQYSVIVIQPDYDIACEGGGCSPISVAGTYYFDDIVQVGAPAPTCTDGVQNGQETGVDCGGPDCPACPPSCTDGILNNGETQIDCGGPNCAPCPPSMDAPEQSSTGADLYVYSGLSTLPGAMSVTNFNYYAFGNVAVPEVDIEGNGNLAGNIQGGAFYFYGAQWDAVDLVAGGYTHVHLNYYATSTTEFNFFLIDATAGIPGGDPTEPRYRFGGSTPDAPITTGSWQSVFIPLSHFTSYTPANPNYDLNDIFQWKFDGNGEVFFDNVYFTNSTTLGTDELSLADFTVSPNPTKNSWTVKTNNIDINSIEVFDILGKQVRNLAPNTSEVTIDANDLNDGIYLAKITSSKGTRTVKLVKN